MVDVGYDALHAAAMKDWPRNLSDSALAAWVELDAKGIHHEQREAVLMEAVRRLKSCRADGKR